MCWGLLPRNEKCGCHFLGIKVQQYTNVKTGRYRTRFQNFVCTLWRFMLQRYGCSSKPKRRLSLKEVAQPPLCAPAARWGCWQARGSPVGAGVASRAHGQPVLVPQGHGGSPTSPQTPAPAQPLWNVRGNYSLTAFLGVTRPPSSADAEVSRWVRESQLFTSYWAGFSIAFFSVSLTVRL